MVIGLPNTAPLSGEICVDTAEVKLKTCTAQMIKPGPPPPPFFSSWLHRRVFQATSCARAASACCSTTTLASSCTQTTTACSTSTRRGLNLTWTCTRIPRPSTRRSVSERRNSFSMFALRNLDRTWEASSVCCGLWILKCLSFSQITLLKYFHNYMSEHLLKAGANIVRREGDELARLPYLSVWFRTKSAIVLHLTNGTVQINFFKVRPGVETSSRRGSRVRSLVVNLFVCLLSCVRTTPRSSCAPSWAPSPTSTRSGSSAPTSCRCWRSLAAAGSWPTVSTSPSWWWRNCWTVHSLVAQWVQSLNSRQLWFITGRTSLSLPSLD